MATTEEDKKYPRKAGSLARNAAAPFINIQRSPTPNAAPNPMTHNMRTGAPYDPNAVSTVNGGDYGSHASGVATGVGLGMIPGGLLPSTTPLPQSPLARVAPTVGVGPMRGNVAPAPTTPSPNPAAAFGIDSYVAQARKDSTGFNPAVINSAVPQPVAGGAVPMAQRQVMQNQNEVAATMNTFYDTPLGKRTALDAAAAAAAVNNVELAKQTDGSTAINNETDTIRNKTAALVDANKNYGGDINAQQRGVQTATANEKMKRSQEQRAAADRAGAKEFDAFVKKDAGDILRNAPKNTPERNAEIRKNQVANIQADSKVQREKEAVRQDQINRANTAKRSERPGQLKEDKLRRSNQAAASKMFGLARSIRNPQAQAEAYRAAQAVADKASAPSTAPRTTFADIQRQDEGMKFAQGIEQTRADAANGASAGRQAMDSAKLAKTQAETNRIINDLTGPEKAAFGAAARLHADLVKSGTAKPDEIAAQQKVMDDIINAKRSGGQGGGVPDYTQEDLEFTAKKNGITVEEVKRRMGIK